MQTILAKRQDKKLFCLVHVVQGHISRKLIASTKPSEKSNNEFIRDLIKHQNPKQLGIFERYKFNKRDQARDFQFMSLNLSIFWDIVILV